jgi:hypothetical protein
VGHRGPTSITLCVQSRDEQEKENFFHDDLFNCFELISIRGRVDFTKAGLKKITDANLFLSRT